MIFSENWLRDWVNPPLLTDELVKKITMAGLEVDSVKPVAATFNKVVIGEVLSVEAHPDAQKLQICHVNVGAEESLTIVCGASNVVVGLRVPTALIGARLEGLKIKKSKLRGVLSYGMLCSAQELGLADSSEGLMPLPFDAPIGEDIRHYLQLEDVSIDIDLTPNRGDCLSIEGIAREVGVLTRSPVSVPEYTPIVASISDTFPVTIQHTKACPRYVGRVIKNVNAQSQTPLWMQERLRRSGLRSITAIVDITNYVLLELGQPMHAFDLNTLSGGIQVRMARTGELLTLLNEHTVQLDEKTLIIADQKQPLAMAGVMGGAESAVMMNTQDIFLESAFFEPQYASGCARRYGLHTDSSHRFERGVDPALQIRAMERATTLLLDIVGGNAGPIIEVAEQRTAPPIIELRASRIQRILGKSLETSEISDILTRLGLKIEQHGETWHVSPPSFRFDIAIEVDLIEELARVHGYNHLPSHPPKSSMVMHPQQSVTLTQLQAVLVQRDYQEAITYSFVDPKVQAHFSPDTESIALANPIASDMAVMRTSLWPGLIQALAYNQKRQQHRVRFFETGLRFVQEKVKIHQEMMIAGIVSGARSPEQWGEKGQHVDFFDVKGDIEALLSLSNGYHFSESTHPALHPGQTARIYQEKECIGIMGTLHPNLIETLDLIAPVYLFELRLSPLCIAPLPQFKEVSKYPSMRRDIAISVPEGVSATQLLDCITKIAPEILIDCQLFDVYQGIGIKDKHKGVAILLVFQALARNLIDSEVDTVLEQVLSTLEQNLGAHLRK